MSAGEALFPPRDRLEAAWRRRRQRQLNELVAQLRSDGKAKVCADAIQTCRQDLLDLGLKVPEAVAAEEAQPRSVGCDVHRLIEMGIDKNEAAGLLAAAGGDLHRAAELFFRR